MPRLGSNKSQVSDTTLSLKPLLGDFLVNNAPKSRELFSVNFSGPTKCYKTSLTQHQAEGRCRNICHRSFLKCHKETLNSQRFQNNGVSSDKVNCHHCCISQTCCHHHHHKHHHHTHQDDVIRHGAGLSMTSTIECAAFGNPFIQNFSDDLLSCDSRVFSESLFQQRGSQMSSSTGSVDRCQLLNRFFTKSSINLSEELYHKLAAVTKPKSLKALRVCTEGLQERCRGGKEWRKEMLVPLKSVVNKTMSRKIKNILEMMKTIDISEETEDKSIKEQEGGHSPEAMPVDGSALPSCRTNPPSHLTLQVVALNPVMGPSNEQQVSQEGLNVGRERLEDQINDDTNQYEHFSWDSVYCDEETGVMILSTSVPDTIPVIPPDVDELLTNGSEYYPDTPTL